MTGDDDYVNFVYDMTDGYCYYCRMRLSFSNYGMVGEKGAWEIDHFIPISRHGANGINNVVPACVDCNTRKSNLMPWDFDSDRFPVGGRDPWDYW